MAQTNIRKKSMRNAPTGDIADFSSNLKLTYSVELNTPEFKTWKEVAVKKLARQGKPFELTGIVDGLSVTVRGKRI